MARTPNQLDTVDVRFSTTTQVRQCLERLVATGFYGRNTSDAVDRLLTETLRRLAAEGVIKLPPVLTKER